MEPKAPSERRTSGQDGILRRLFGRPPGAARPRSEATILAVASGKGGTGKSFVSTNFSVALSDEGRAVTLVDCDFGLGNAHLLLGVSPRLTIQHVLAGEARLDDVCVRTSYGPMLVPGGSGISRLAELAENELVLLARGLETLAGSADCVLLDLASGISPQCILMMLVAHEVLLVTNPEIAALTDAYAVVKCLSRQPGAPPVSVVVNRVSSREQARATFDKLAEVARRFSGVELHYLGAIPEEPAVTPRRLGQAPLLASHPECEAACCIKDILGALVRRTGDLRPRNVSDAQTVVFRMRQRLLAGGRS